jgi:hypothetical protein
LRQGGHELREIDLCAERFDPVLGAAERKTYLADTTRSVPGIRGVVMSPSARPPEAGRIPSGDRMSYPASEGWS